jgi:hypothetical protein
MISDNETFYTHYKSFLGDVARQLTEARGLYASFLASEHCTDGDGIRQEITRHLYLCAGAAMYFREIAPRFSKPTHAQTLN